MKKLELFAALTKIDEAKREVWGLATAEVVDKDGEVFDYVSSKPYFEAWSREIAEATSGRSLGNVREMHRSSAVGKLIDLQFDDANKTIAVGAKIVDDIAWEKCVEGVYTGFSIGGRYVDLWPDGDFLRFTAQPVEISVVDNPAVREAHFRAVKEAVGSQLSAVGQSAFERNQQKADWPIADSQKPTAMETREDISKNGEQMKPEQEEKLDKAIAQSTDSIEKIVGIDQKLQALEAGMRELGESFKKFVDGFAESVAPAAKRVARTGVPVSKEDDGRRAASAEPAEETLHDSLKAALANPQPGTGVVHAR